MSYINSACNHNVYSYHYFHLCSSKIYSTIPLLFFNISGFCYR